MIVLLIALLISFLIGRFLLRKISPKRAGSKVAVVVATILVFPFALMAVSVPTYLLAQKAIEKSKHRKAMSNAFSQMDKVRVTEGSHAGKEGFVTGSRVKDGALLYSVVLSTGEAWIPAAWLTLASSPPR